MRKHQIIKRIGLFLLVLMLAMLLLVGCSSKGAVVGKWQDQSGQTMTFLNDGTVTTGGLLNVTGKYSFPDNSHIKIELEGLWSLAGPQVYEFRIDGGKLVLKDSFKNENILTKIK